MDIIRGCAECKRLSDAYESETMTWFRLEGHLRIAEHGHNKAAVAGIATELEATTRKRMELRSELTNHKHKTHGGNSRVAPLTMRA